MKTIKIIIATLFCTGGVLVSCGKVDPTKESDLDKNENVLTAVDLGLSVKWASQNVGAASQYSLGDYFGWGEIVPKTVFEEEAYRFGTNKPDGYTKYNYIDNKTVLDIEDDAARARMGGKWRMPTFSEMEELREKCAWKWIEEIDENGHLIKGFQITGPSKNSIFIPLGEMDNGKHTYGNAYMSSCLEYWNLGESDYFSVRGLSLENNRVNVFWGKRYAGRQIRAVSE